MNLYQILCLAVLLLAVTGTFTNTTDFWKDALKATEIHFQCYSGRSILTQATKRSIGTIPKADQVCTTACTRHKSMDPPRKIPKCLSFYGSKEDPEPALNSLPTPKMDPSGSPRMASRNSTAPGTSWATLYSSISPSE